MVCIHSADNLNGDVAQCNPYCMLFNNRKKVKQFIYQIYIFTIELYLCVNH